MVQSPYATCIVSQLVIVRLFLVWFSYIFLGKSVHTEDNFDDLESITFFF